MPKLMCMTRLSNLDLNMPIILEPMHTFPVIRDLVTDVSWNFRAKLTVKPFPAAFSRFAGWNLDHAAGRRRAACRSFSQVHRVFPMPGCVCHVLREHHKEAEFIGPRLLVYAAALEMHPLDTEDRVDDPKKKNTVSVTATSPLAAARYVRNRSPSPKMRLFRSRSGWVDRFFDPLKQLFNIL